jgi:osmotically-inducible protein OsmY
MLFKRQRKRPIDRLRETALRTAGRSAGTARDSARKAAKWTGGRVRVAQREVARRMPAQRARVERRKRLAMLAAGGAVGAVLTALFDPVRGKARRARLKDQSVAFLRRRARRVERLGRKVASDVEGYRERMAFGQRDYVAPNDVTLEAKVESEVLGRTDVPKGSILINVEEGIVVLRGEVELPDQIEHIEKLVRDVDGVRGVENLLHVKGTPPPKKPRVRLS